MKVLLLALVTVLAGIGLLADNPPNACTSHGGVARANISEGIVVGLVCRDEFFYYYRGG